MSEDHGTEPLDFRDMRIHSPVQHYGSTRKYGGQRSYQIPKQDVPELLARGWAVIHRTTGIWSGYDYLAPPPGTTTVPKILVQAGKRRVPIEPRRRPDGSANVLRVLGPIRVQPPARPEEGDAR